MFERISEWLSDKSGMHLDTAIITLAAVTMIGVVITSNLIIAFIK